jgi:DNA-binding NarL/FixJ family response regulator/HPt (histidine-containing phosphotransfer) domain-containing protein
MVGDPADGRPVQVLVVDDNPGDAKLVELSLGRASDGEFRCERAGRVRLALERLGAGPVDAVLLDLGLPDSRGMEGLRRLRSAAPEVAVVVLTGSEDPALVREAIAEGAQEYQVKGIFPPDHLARIVRAAVRHQRIETLLARGESPDLEAGATAEEDAIVLVPARGPVRANARYRAAVGAGGPDPATPWLRALLGSARPASRTAVPGTAPASGSSGVVRVPRPDREPIDVAYVVRWFGAGTDERALVRLRFPAPAPSAPTAGSPAARPESDPIDPGAWGQLLELSAGDERFLSVLLEAFVEESGASVARLEAAVAAGDRIGVGDAAHRLKSTLAQVGALALSRSCAELERDARGLSGPDLATSVRAVAAGIPEVRETLRRRILRR